MENRQLRTSELKRASLNSHYFNMAYDDAQKVVYVNSLMPTELIFAMGLVPFGLGQVGGLLAQGRAAAHFINIAQENHFSSDLCSTSHCILGAACEDALPTPDFLIMTSEPCDVGSKIYHNLSQMYEKDFFMLDIPYFADEESVAYLRIQLMELVKTMEDRLGVTLDPDRLKAAIGHSNTAAEYIRKTNEFARMVPSPLSALETMDIVASFHLLGSEELADMCRERYEELKQLANESRPKAASGRKPRVFWHGLRPFYDNGIFDRIENECGIEIISEMNINDINPFSWDLMDPEKPFTSLARKTLRMSGCGPIDGFFNDRMFARLEAHAIDGVIAFSSRGCRHLISIQEILRDQMMKQGYAYLVMEGDYIDRRKDSFECIKTRIDAFAEVLHGRMQ